MDAYENDDWINDACRLCGEQADEKYNIFEKNDEGRQILQLIKDCLPVIIYRTDPLPKQVCEKCYGKLNLLWEFKKICIGTAEKQRGRLQESDNGNNKSIQLFLQCHESDRENNLFNNFRNVETTTEDFHVLCTNCKTSVIESNNFNSELELCTDLRRVIADSLKKNKVITESPVRTRRKRIQPFYNEVDDSLCSSLTEFTNTESSQCLEEFASDMDSLDSDQDMANRNNRKRRKIEEEEEEEQDEKEEVEKEDDKTEENMSEDLLVVQKEEEEETEKYIIKFGEEVENLYLPFSLLQLCLNAINKTNLEDYTPDDFYMKVNHPRCRYCSEEFVNTKILALHEMKHMSIELGDKVDNPILWHDSRDDANVRNKWLNSCDENESYEYTEDTENETTMDENLLIPVGTDIPAEHKLEEEIILIDTKPVVNGIALSDYTKEERKAFYPTMRISGINKKFCRLCRYSFKDNWAIESHYFSSACFYTCRYCGMRFNKQRHRFAEHVLEHEQNGDPLSKKIYAANKMNNVVPKIIQPNKVKKVPPPATNIPLMGAIRVKNFLDTKPNFPAGIEIKQEIVVDKVSPALPKHVQTSQSKTENQAFFCRKCYKVFFKLDEFNVHSKNCDYNPNFPPVSGKAVQQNHGAPKTVIPPQQQNQNMKNGDAKSPSGRPVRNCAKDAGPYKDELYIPESLLRKEPANSGQSFVCFICNTPFPTIYSRNSHMRIHKGETAANPPGPKFKSMQNNYNNYREMPPLNHNDFNFQNVQIKQEPMDYEPTVEIHESPDFAPPNLGAVSITPISKNPNQKPSINPNIMKLVQNNPHLTIRGSPNSNSVQNEKPSGSQAQFPAVPNDSDKSYKCSNCWEAFANKSHLYFHKKNQCEGSRFPCPFCKKRFGTEAAYSSHIFYSHPE